MGDRSLSVVSRASALARAQTGECLRAIAAVLPPDRPVETWVVDTPGDRDKRTPLNDPSVPDDFFTRDLDRAVLDGRADLAVHSAKDLPRKLPDGLAVACLLPARDPRDVLVFRDGADPAAAPGRIGVSSPRREAALRRLYPAAQQLPLRGTIGERLERLDRGEFDAIVVAACALDRLGLSGRNARPMPWSTTPLQGQLAVVCRESDADWIGRLKPLDFRMHLTDRPAEPPAAAPVPADSSGPALLFTGTNPAGFEDFGPLIHWPAIRLRPRPLSERAAAIEAGLDAARGVLFASAFAVRCFVEALFHAADARRLRGKALLAAGPATAEELERMGLHADAVAEGWEGLASLAARLDASLRGAYFYPCSAATPAGDRARLLARAGVTAAPHVFYETEANRPGPLPPAPFDRVLFTSPSTVESYFRFNPGERATPRRWLAIGPSTRRALEAMGLRGETLNAERRTPNGTSTLTAQHPTSNIQAGDGETRGAHADIPPFRLSASPSFQHSNTPSLQHSTPPDPRLLNPQPPALPGGGDHEP